MQSFAPYLEKIENQAHRQRMESLLSYIQQRFPTLGMRIAWNQPMFTDHDTFIIAFSIAKAHIAVAPEHKAIEHFSNEIKQSGFSATKELFRILHDQDVPYELLDQIISYNIQDKKECRTFWRVQANHFSVVKD